MTREDYELLEKFVLSRELSGINGMTFKMIIEILNKLKQENNVESV